MEAVFSSETSIDFQWTTRRYIPEDSTLGTNIILGNAVSGCQNLILEGRLKLSTEWK
jgi:hypothetical protein